MDMDAKFYAWVGISIDEKCCFSLYEREIPNSHWNCSVNELNLKLINKIWKKKKQKFRAAVPTTTYYNQFENKLMLI